MRTPTWDQTHEAAMRACRLDVAREKLHAWSGAVIEYVDQWGTPDYLGLLLMNWSCTDLCFETPEADGWKW